MGTGQPCLAVPGCVPAVECGPAADRSAAIAAGPADRRPVQVSRLSGVGRHEGPAELYARALHVGRRAAGQERREYSDADVAAGSAAPPPAAASRNGGRRAVSRRP